MKTNLKTKLGQWQKRASLGGVCEKCGKEKERLTVDHRIPQSLLQQLGYVDEVYEWEENFVLLCQSCNAFKANRIDVTDHKAITELKYLINKL